MNSITSALTIFNINYYLNDLQQLIY